MSVKSTKQIFITGCYRSGTEYITNLLGNHPRLATSMYVVNFMRFCYQRYDPVGEEDNYSRLIFDATWRMRARWGVRLDVHALLDECQQRGQISYAFLYDLMMSRLLLDEQKTIWAEKNQLLWSKIPDFLELFPEGQVIHVLRDPRSVLASFKKNTYVPPPAYLGAIFNCFDSMQKALQYQQSLPPARYRLICFEDVLGEPEASLRSLYDFLGLDATHDLLSQDDWRTSSGERWNHNSAFMSANDDGKKFDAQAARHRWKTELTPADLALCEAVNAVGMEAFGYVHSGRTTPWPTMIKSLIEDQRLTQYLRRWLVAGQGVEEFPTDPIEPQNWEENALRKAA